MIFSAGGLQNAHEMHGLSFSLQGIESSLDPPFSLFLPRIIVRFSPFCRQSQSDWPHWRLHLPPGQVPLHWYVRVLLNVYIYELCLKNQTLFLSPSPSCLSPPIGLSPRWVNARIVVHKLYRDVLSLLIYTNNSCVCVCVCNLPGVPYCQDTLTWDK